MKRVVIVGMGFGGLRAAQVLARSGLEVLVVDQHNYHLFQPLLYQVASAGLEQESIAYPVRAVIRRWCNVRYLFAQVQAVDLKARHIVTSQGTHAYDYLILAAGSVTNFYGMQSVKEHAFVLKALDDAVQLRNHILSLFERAAHQPDAGERQAMMTFVVVGAGPTGVELCGALSELIRHTLAKDYPELSLASARIVLVEALDHVLPTVPAPLQRYAQKRLEELGVHTMLSKRVQAAEGDRIVFTDGTDLTSRTVIWAAGVRAAPLADSLDLPKGPGGRIRVQPDLSVEARPEVFVVGDMAYVEQDGEPLAMVAPVAMQQGEYAARSVLARERGEQPMPFRYRDKGTMAIIGRYSAVANAFGINMRGLPAWLAWLLLHLYYLVGFRNRLIAMLNWVYAYLLTDPKVRLITQPATAQSRRFLGGHKSSN